MTLASRKSREEQGNKAVRQPVHAEPIDLSEPSNLLAPDPRPGFVQRWIRIDVRGDGRDTMNYSRALREGWQPRPVDSIPAAYHPPIKGNGMHVGNLVVHDLVLCEMPEERFALIKERKRLRTVRQNQAIDGNVFREFGKGKDLLEVSRKSTVTRGRRPPVD